MQTCSFIGVIAAPAGPTCTALPDLAPTTTPATRLALLYFSFAGNNSRPGISDRSYQQPTPTLFYLAAYRRILVLTKSNQVHDLGSYDLSIALNWHYQDILVSTAYFEV